MPAMLPPALEALMRLQGRIYPTEEEAIGLGSPIGMPMSNQVPMTGHRNVPDGSLNAISQLIAGLGGPMPYTEPMQPDPQTLYMRSTVSPGEPTTPLAHGAMLAPSGQGGAVEALLRQMGGGSVPSQADVQGQQALAARTGQGMGIVNQGKYDAFRQGMATDEAARRQNVTNRAMQVAQARTNRMSGMDPRTAALLAALNAGGGDQQGLGGMLMADALLGKGAGLQMAGMQNDRQIADASIKAKQQQAAPTTPAEEKPNAAIDSAIRSGDSAALSTALVGEARKVVADLRKSNTPFKQTVDAAINTLRVKHGATQQQASDAVAAAMEMQPGAFRGREGKAKQPFSSPISDFMDEKIGGLLYELGLY